MVIVIAPIFRKCMFRFVPSVFSPGGYLFLEGTFSCSRFDLMLLVVFCHSRRALHCRGIRVRKLRKKLSQREFVLVLLPGHCSSDEKDR